MTMTKLFAQTFEVIISLGKRFEQLGINPDFDPEHQLLALAPRLDFFRR